MKLLITGPEKRTKSVIAIIDYAQQKFEKVMYVPTEAIRIEKNGTVEAFYKGINLGDFDVVLPLISRKNSELGFALLRIFSEKKVYSPISYNAFFYLSNEIMIPLVLESKNIKYPKTYISKSRKSFDKIIEDLRYPVFVKLSGNKKGMIIVSKSSLNTVLDTMESLSQNIILQIIPEGVRIKAIKLFSDFYALKDGEKYKLDKEEREFMNSIANVFDSKIIDVEFIRSDDGLVVFNIDLMPSVLKYANIYGKSVIESYVEPLLVDEGALSASLLKRLMRRIKM